MSVVGVVSVCGHRGEVNDRWAGSAFNDWGEGFRHRRSCTNDDDYVKEMTSVQLAWPSLA